MESVTHSLERITKTLLARRDRARRSRYKQQGEIEVEGEREKNKGKRCDGMKRRGWAV